MGLGLAVGAGTGVLVGLGSGDDDPQQWFALSAEEKAAVFGLGLGLTGGAVGLVIGLLNRHDVWTPTVPENVDLNVLPRVSASGTGLHVGLAFRFN